MSWFRLDDDEALTEFFVAQLREQAARNPSLMPQDIERMCSLASARLAGMCPELRAAVRRQLVSGPH